MPTLQASFFCGKTWNDVITNCPKKCPSGEDPECPEGEFCFAYTGCTEEKGYPDGEGGDVDGEGIVNPDTCVPFEVTIVADNWPKENSWTLTNEAGDIVKEGINDNLVTGEPANWHECISKKVCYEFTIHDTGGDGICCDHGGGSYEVKFDGKVVKNGAAFYDFESTEVGRCGDTIAPTEAPKEAAKPSGGGGGGGNSGGGPSYRCVATPLVQSGYKVASDKCDSFTSCFNQFINDGDDWFCDENAQCIEAPACGTNEDDSAIDDPAPPAVAGVSYRCVAAPLVESGYKISSDKCDLFDDCYNKDTNDGDAFFCDDIAQCIEAPACIVEKETPAVASVPPPSNAVTANPPAASEDSKTEGAKPPAISDSSIESAKPPATSASTDNSVVDASLGKRPIASKPSAGTKPVPNKASIEDMPTLSPTSNSTTLLPTFSPTNVSAINRLI